MAREYLDEQRRLMATDVIARTRAGLEFKPPVAEITLKNPPLNVIDTPMMKELAAVLAEIEERPEISTIVFRGSEKCFSAGVDVATHAPGKVNAMLEGFHSLIRALVGTRKVTIAAVYGNCLGGGAELAMMCDIVVTADDANWGFPEITLGCYPPVAATALSALIGQKRAADLVLTGTTILGTGASEIGLATRAVSQEQVKSAVAKTLDPLQKLRPAAPSIT